MGKTSIEWVRGADGSDGMSWNALRAITKHDKRSAHHCEHVNEACRFCYAERMNARLGGLPFKPGHRADYNFVVNEKTLREPLKRKKPTRYFVESMSDAFGSWWPDEYIDQLYAVMAICQRHTFINLSKRPARRRIYLDDVNLEDRLDEICHHLNPDAGEEWHYPAKWPLPNVIEGTSVSCQEEADEFVPILLDTRAAVRCVSAEPLLGPIDLTHLRGNYGVGDDMHRDMVMDALTGKAAAAWHGRATRPDLRVMPKLDWVIVGGESGPNARPMHPDWARSLRDQCAAAGVPFFYKQTGEWAELDRGPYGPRMVRAGDCFIAPDGRQHLLGADLGSDLEGVATPLRRVGKKSAGRLLDGKEHNGFPNEHLSP